MTERTPDPLDPANDPLDGVHEPVDELPEPVDELPEPGDEFDEPGEAAQPDDPAKPSATVTPTRRAIWVFGGGLGVYMIGRGLYGVLTGEDQQP